MEHHDVQAAPWATGDTAPGPQGTALILADLLALGTVARLDRLDEALREAAAAALEAAGDAIPAVAWELQVRAEMHRAGRL